MRQQAKSFFGTLITQIVIPFRRLALPSTCQIKFRTEFQKKFKYKSKGQTFTKKKKKKKKNPKKKKEKRTTTIAWKKRA